MKFEELTKEEQNKWNDKANKLSTKEIAFLVILNKPRCIECKFKNPKNYGKLDFHYKSTHGYTIKELIDTYDQEGTIK
jgi:16S rRNA U516 pseudouridylate synthase RsuA-like enzyme